MQSYSYLQILNSISTLVDKMFPPLSTFILIVFNVLILDFLLWLNFSFLQKDWKGEMGAGEEKLVNPECTPIPYSKNGYNSFEEFYPFYLGEHHHRATRRMHLIGTTNSIGLVALSLCSGYYPLIALAVGQAYGLAWTSHFFIEKNKPATFSHPIYSLMGDFRMWWEVMSGRRKF